MVEEKMQMKKVKKEFSENLALPPEPHSITKTTKRHYYDLFVSQGRDFYLT